MKKMTVSDNTLLILVAPLGFRDDLHSMLCSLIVQLSQIFNIGLNIVCEDILFVVPRQVIEMFQGEWHALPGSEATNPS
jgi:hypothetical protein